MAMIRYGCAVDGFDQNWAEISDSWTRREIVAMDHDDDSAIEQLQNKIGVCHLETDNGVITAGEDITVDAVLDMRAEVHGFLLRLPWRVWQERSNLGKVNARQLSPPNDLQTK